MTRFSKEQRQEIVREFCIRHNGTFNAALFFEEVRANPDHPAYNWFEWSTEKGWLEYNIDRARDFSQGLRISFSVEEISHDGVVTVRTAEVPLVLSPVAERRLGGGYHLTDPSKSDDMDELCRQAASALASWLKRYEAALVHSGGSARLIQKQVRFLEAASEVAEEAA